METHSLRFTTARDGSKEQVPLGSSDTFPAVLSFYESVEAMLAAVNAGGNAAHFEDFGDLSRPTRPLRALVGMMMVAAGSVGNVLERTYLVLPGELRDSPTDATLGVQVHYLGATSWSVGAQALPGEPTIYIPSGAVFTPSPASGSILKSMTGQDVESVSTVQPSGDGQAPAYLNVGDIGPGKGLLRVFAFADAVTPTQALPTALRWL